MDQPHSKFEHVWAIIRAEDYEVPEEHRITVVKVIRSGSGETDEAELAAIAEVRRLNEVNAGKRCHYFAQLSRLVDIDLGPIGVDR
jgi:hypothetical protein